MAQTALKSAKEEKMILKIQYNHCLALLELSLLVKRPEELDNYHTKAKSTFKKIELTLDPVSKKNLESKFQLVNEKLSKPLIEALRKK